MSKVKVARSAGFCFGVSRSVKMAEEMLESGPCLSYGPLIHNDDVVSSLAERGLSVINSPADVRPGDRVLIRSHGISLAEEEALRRAGAEITDATCPNVAHIHRLAASASAAGRQVLVIGAAGHPKSGPSAAGARAQKLSQTHRNWKNCLMTSQICALNL